jgi:hypothetical protein
MIIGSPERKVKEEYEEGKKGRLYEKALTVRKKYLCDPLNIRMMH